MHSYNTTYVKLKKASVLSNEESNLCQIKKCQPLDLNLHHEGDYKKINSKISSRLRLFFVGITIINDSNFMFLFLPVISVYVEFIFISCLPTRLYRLGKV